MQAPDKIIKNLKILPELGHSATHKYPSFPKSLLSLLVSQALLVAL